MQTDSVDYDYTYQWLIGPISITGSPEQAMAKLQAQPTDWFPFPVGGCGAFSDGAVCTIHPGQQFFPLVDLPLIGGEGDVRVRTTSVSVQFTVLPDNYQTHYFDKPGSTIEFRLRQIDDSLVLMQIAHAETNGLVKPGFATIGAHQTWQLQAKLTARTLGVHPPACLVSMPLSCAGG